MTDRKYAIFPLLCGLVLLLAPVGCQYKGTSSLTAGRDKLLKLSGRGHASMAFNQPLPASNDQTIAASDSFPANGHSPATGSSGWINWLNRLPQPPRIPLPRTDLGGDDIAVLQPPADTSDAESN